MEFNESRRQNLTNLLLYDMRPVKVRSMRFAHVSLICLLSMGCRGSSDKDSSLLEPETMTQPTWLTIESMGQDGAWLRAHSPPDTPEEIWLVGGQPNRGAIKIGNAIKGFQTLELPTGTPLLNWADGTSTNMWVGGLYGSILQWNGAVWIDHSLDIEEAIWGLVVTENSEKVVAVGGSSRWGGDEGFVYSYQDDEWTAHTLPEELNGLSNLFKIAFDGEQYWMVGTAGALLYGSPEALTAIPTGLTQDLITAISTPSSSTVQIVGGRGTGIYLTGQNGTLSTPSQLIAGINGIATDSAGNSILVGEMGYSQLLMDTDSTAVEPTPVTTHILHAAAVHTIDDKQYWYAVGGNLATAESTFEGTILAMEWSP